VTRRITDLEGRTYGRLTVQSAAGLDSRGSVLWLCSCTCGNTKVLSTIRLNKGTKSCGCLAKELGKAIARSGRLSQLKHGNNRRGKRSLAHGSWINMIQRCCNPNAPKFKYYGAKGIAVCPRWHDFDAFLSDVGARPRGTSLGRVLDHGNYAPGNAFWMTNKQQGQHKSLRNLMIKVSHDISTAAQ
jgi:hypothetical protein